MVLAASTADSMPRKEVMEKTWVVIDRNTCMVLRGPYMHSETAAAVREVMEHYCPKAGKASSASCWLARRRQQTPKTIGPCLRTKTSNAASSPWGRRSHICRLCLPREGPGIGVSDKCVGPFLKRAKRRRCTSVPMTSSFNSWMTCDLAELRHIDRLPLQRPSLLPPDQRSCFVTPTTSGTAAFPTVRCVIYTRKSAEEGLDQEFNSLDAQREAAQAYIASPATCRLELGARNADSLDARARRCAASALSRFRM
jgi:hypothetical protein